MVTPSPETCTFELTLKSPPSMTYTPGERDTSLFKVRSQYVPGCRLVGLLMFWQGFATAGAGKSAKGSAAGKACVIGFAQTVVTGLLNETPPADIRQSACSFADP